MTTAQPAQNSADTRRFLAAIELTERDAEVFDRAFEVVPQYVPWPKAYGGDSVAQAAAAALATVGDDRELHALHSSFLRPVSIGEPVRYEVELLRDGRGYSTRHVRGYQGGKPVFLTTASFQVPETGETRAPAMPEVPQPETLPSAAEYLAARDGGHSAATDYWSHGRGFDMRHIAGPLYLEVDGVPGQHQGVWLRAFDELPADQRTQQLALAYACDYTILEPTLRELGLHWSSPGLVTASLDHSMWFHTPARADDWILYAQESAGVQSGRGLNIGRFFTRTGTLIATVAQEGMIRRGS
ncbi:acyl-CoA thioesterase [Leucobacter luti]|uniref:Acyl-CoA thioesterase-2 n=1 Tax=Leucobacter luti TaxID=340320 RepID=A0A4V6MCY1_9MICO|nr:acyl-CoA thioesterase domain-containing protein [Leucobacter luti]MBL3698772.1 acyl-CoA thioesterase II [Leucobacter luti]RZT66149.1 acyl-CoA thioesterase-2 [Leucobacter luti]